MLNEKKFKAINPSDKVFRFEGQLVKVRLVKKEVLQKNKILGPSAISLHLSASICDKKGKAIPRGGGGYCICPHSLTIPITTTKPDIAVMKNALEDALRPLIAQTVNWYNNLAALEGLIAEWENPKEKAKINSNKT